MQVCHSLCNLRKRRSKQAYIHDKRNDYTDFYRAVQYQYRADNAHRNIGNVADDVHQRLHHTGQKLRLPVSVVYFVVKSVESFVDLAHGARNAYNVLTGVHFFDVAVKLAKALLARHKVSLTARHNKYRHHRADNGYA